MQLPRKFAGGRKVGDADVYGELLLWPGGYFVYQTHVRARLTDAEACVNARFALLDSAGKLLGVYGMPAGYALCIGPQAEGLTSERNDTLYGELPAEGLRKAAMVALVFGPENAPVDEAALPGLASAGQAVKLVQAPG